MVRSRFSPLWASVGLAIGFVTVRLFWRFVAGDAAITDLAEAAVRALPFAIGCVAIGTFASVVDIRELLLRLSATGRSSPIATASAIGVLSLTELGSEATQTRAALQLRGRRATRRLFLPVFQHAIEHALGIGAALALRAGGPSGSPATLTPIRFEGATLRWGSREVLRDVHCEIGSGITVLTGPTGGGKTSVLELIAGLATEFHGGVLDGRVWLGSTHRGRPIEATARQLRYLPQQVEAAFVGATVAGEGSLTGANGATGAPLIAELSAGERTSLALSRILSGSPDVVLLDEPFVDLDAAQRGAAISTIARLRDAGACIVIAEHHVTELSALEPNWLTVEDGRVRTGRWQPPVLPAPELARRRSNGPTLHIGTARLSYRGKSVSCPLETGVPAGTIIGLLGPNGSGKTSLLRALSIPGSAGITVDGVEASGAKPNPTRVSLVPDDVRRLFICETLDEELVLADRFAGLRPGETRATLAALLPSTDLAHLAGTHPRDLSAGTQRALAIAIQMGHRPRLLLIDEPTRGLDPGARIAIAEILECVAETGTAIILASHDGEWLGRVADHTWRMADGRVCTAEESEVQP
ncbi:MAG TPA: ATP-binding cassette domain-containing protein [Microbacteriaceae bacterium]|nr:ATP-binding cassette domain-containing protein [Microbacteriaceae bacterium]